MKKYVNVVVTDADGNKEMREKAVVVSLQRQGNENKTTISLVNVEDLDFVVAVCSLLKVVDDLDLNESDDVMVLGKGNKEREVYLNARAHLHLKLYLESRTDDNPALFVGTRAPHKRLTKSGIRNILKKIGRAAGVSKVHPHRFRRTSATDLLRMGMPIEQVQELLGHVKIETTRIYCTVTKEQVRASHRRFMAA